MNADCVVTAKEGTYQHGKISDRIYLMKLNYFDPIFFKDLEELAMCRQYTKIIAKTPGRMVESLKNFNFNTEAVIPAFYSGVEDCHFMCKYYSHERRRSVNNETIQTILKVAKSKSAKHLSAQNFEVKELSAEHLSKVAQLYRKIFESYPFPIFQEEYLHDTMTNGSIYFGVFDGRSLVACASSETDPTYKNAEMTDFAVLPEYRGHNLSSLLLKAMEDRMRIENYQTLYTIARSSSYGMNCTFGGNGYHFGGTLYNNTQICGKIESMNVWYKNIDC